MSIILYETMIAGSYMLAPYLSQFDSQLSPLNDASEQAKFILPSSQTRKLNLCFLFLQPLFPLYLHSFVLLYHGTTPNPG